MVRGGVAGLRTRATAASNAGGHVVDLQGDRLDAVAVLHQALGVGMIGPERRGQHEGDVPLTQHVARLVPHPGLEPRVGDDVEAERVAIEVGGLARVAHEHPHVVDALQRQWRRWPWPCLLRSGFRARGSSRIESFRSRRTVADPTSGDFVQDDHRLGVRSSSRPSQNTAMASRTSCAPWKNRASSKRGSKKTSSSSSMVWPGVLGLDAVVPGEEGHLEAGEPGRLDVEQAVLQLLPEAGGGPVLDGEAGPLGDPIVLAAVEPLELVAEVQRVGPPVPALAQVVEAQAERLADGQQPLEVGGAEAGTGRRRPSPRC